MTIVAAVSHNAFIVAECRPASQSFAEITTSLFLIEPVGIQKNQFAAQTVLACRNDNFAWGCFHCLHLMHTLVLSWTCRTEVAGVAIVIEKPASGKRIFMFAVLGCVG